VSSDVTIRLEPRGAAISTPRGTPLQDVLFPHGVEFPCGGHGRCKGCRVRVLSGTLPVTAPQQRMLPAADLAAGWRLSCQCAAEADLTLELAQWEAAILSDISPFSFTPGSGFGIAIDVGTTTIVGQLLDLSTANVLAVRTALNPQARFGADIMTRVAHALSTQGHRQLVDAVRHTLAELVSGLIAAADCPPGEVQRAVLVGNTVMHHLVCSFDVSPLSRVPFDTPHLHEARLDPAELGWTIGPSATVRFLPPIAGYVGSDILAGIVATGMDASGAPSALIDLGTNGEIVLGDAHRLLCCSTAAGPAFEGARIYMGMRAATGAVSAVEARDGAFVCHVLGGAAPKGICGSGLVDAAAAALDLGRVRPGGRLADGGSWLPLCGPVKLSQTDIRELQLAKGAIAAGISTLLGLAGLDTGGLANVFLAGAFGNYVNVTSARRIGLLPFPEEMITLAGNTALRGAKIELFAERDLTPLARRITHVHINEIEGFQDRYVEAMVFPSTQSGQ
jgi:uncharacterized 2Fe-2S/4Fe-4S cluster protein (DUF4445 family)